MFCLRVADGMTGNSSRSMFGIFIPDGSFFNLGSSNSCKLLVESTGIKVVSVSNCIGSLPSACLKGRKGTANSFDRNILVSKELRSGAPP